MFCLHSACPLSRQKFSVFLIFQFSRDHFFVVLYVFYILFTNNLANLYTERACYFWPFKIVSYDSSVEGAYSRMIFKAIWSYFPRLDWGRLQVCM